MWSCPSGKVPYQSRGAALDAIRGMRRKGRRDPAAVEPYRCGDCSDWHLFSRGLRPARRRDHRR